MPRPHRPARPGAVALVAVVLAALGAAPAGAQTKKPEQSPCYGAASRDTVTPCRDPALRLAVSPTPIEAVLQPYAACGRLPWTGIVRPCRFGFPGPNQLDDVALLGDSHAGHWRAAVRQVAQERRWRGTSLTRTGCAFNTAPRDIAERDKRKCDEWNRGIVKWFGKHPEVHTVFTSANAGLELRVPRGRSELEARVQGYLKAWRKLPRSVSRIVVLRDTTRRPLNLLDCVEAAMEAKKPAGTACAADRRKLLRPDAQVIAARRLKSSRVVVADLSDYICSKRLCFPVVGGALVNKDQSHMTTAFAASLGPFLLRKVNALGPFPDERPAPKP